MTESRALTRAPLTIYPVVLVFVMGRSMLVGDMRELFVAPFSALLMSLVGYPLALAAAWLVLRLWPGLATASLGLSLVVGVVCAELAFWLLVAPLWQPEVFSAGFCAAMVAVCGLATAGAFYWLRTGQNPRQRIAS